jgi:transposase
VKQQLRLDPLGGDLFLFVSKRRTGCKVLMWDGTGLCIFMKKLERGRFAELWGDGSGATVRLTVERAGAVHRGPPRWWARRCCRWRR